MRRRFFGRHRRGVETGRRSGPLSEPRWWDLDDQRFIESDLLPDRLPIRGWRPVPMLNNTERIEPYGSGRASRAMTEVRARRRLTALDEGRAWRRRSTGSLLVLRAEMFEGDDGEHRRSWQQMGPEVLEETWREGWEERGRRPGWVEARWEEVPDDFGLVGASLDWIRVEDHTGDAGDVLVYHHVSVWADRLHSVLTLRVPLGESPDPILMWATAALHRAGVSRRTDPDLGFV